MASNRFGGGNSYERRLGSPFGLIRGGVGGRSRLGL